MRRRDFLGLTGLAALAGRRALARPAKPPKTRHRGAARVVVIGGGFAGSAAALALKRLDASIDVTLIDRDARYVTCPMSNEALVGLRDLATLPITREGVVRAGVRYARDRADAIDPERREVRLGSGQRLRYDRLVVAPGIRFLWGTPEGYDEAASLRMPHAWKAGDQTARLAAELREMKPGGVVAISVPRGLMRCPPGPYERASLIADFLKRHKPRAKALIFDANNHFPRQDVFAAAWEERYRGLVEWISVLDGGAVERVDVRTSTLFTDRGAHRVDVANVIPPQAPGSIALASGLCSGHGWCPVDARSFESKTIPRVHVIGDACIAGAMPKSASAAASQADQCAAAIAALLADREIPQRALDSVCYSLVAPHRGVAIHGRFEVDGEEIRSIAEPDAAPASASNGEAANAERWYAKIRARAFGA